MGLLKPYSSARGFNLSLGFRSFLKTGIKENPLEKFYRGGTISFKQASLLSSPAEPEESFPVLIHLGLLLLDDMLVFGSKEMFEPPLWFQPFYQRFLLFGLIIELPPPILNLKKWPEASLDGQSGHGDGLASRMPPASRARRENVQESRAIDLEGLSRLGNEVAPVAG